MTGWVIMLTLATTAAPSSANMEAVLVLTTGSAMTVRSYAVDGSLIRIVGTSGEALVLRAEPDLAASEIATKRHRERAAQQSRMAPAPEREGPMLASTRVRSDSVIDASRRALARGGRSAITTTQASVEVDDTAAESTAGATGESTAESPAAATDESTAESADSAAKPGVPAVGMIGKYELAAGARESLTVAGTGSMTFGFQTRLNAETAAACKANGVRFFDSRAGGATVSSKTGASLTAVPTDGVVKLSVENLEAFPIAVEVYRR